MVESKYSQVSLPRALIEQVDREISKSQNGYRSRAEFVVEALREKLKREVMPR